MTGKYIDGVKVVANMENAAEYVCKEWISFSINNIVYKELASQHDMDVF